MKKNGLESFCKNSLKFQHNFELYVLENANVIFKCVTCDYTFLQDVEKPEWLLKQLKDEKNNI